MKTGEKKFKVGLGYRLMWLIVPVMAGIIGLLAGLLPAIVHGFRGDGSPGAFLLVIGASVVLTAWLRLDRTGHWVDPFSFTIVEDENDSWVFPAVARTHKNKQGVEPVYKWVGVCLGLVSLISSAVVGYSLVHPLLSMQASVMVILGVIVLVATFYVAGTKNIK